MNAVILTWRTSLNFNQLRDFSEVVCSREVELETCLTALFKVQQAFLRTKLYHGRLKLVI